MAESTKLFYNPSRVAETAASADVFAAGGSKGETIVSNIDGSPVGGASRRSDAFQANTGALTSSTSDQAIKAATASLRHYIAFVCVSTDTAQNFTIRDGTTILFGPQYVPANSVWSAPIPPGVVVQCSVNTAINIRCSGSTGNISATVLGYTAA